MLSLCGTLHANLPRVAQVRFLVDGQPRATLAGHADLTRTYLAGDAVSAGRCAPMSTTGIAFHRRLRFRLWRPHSSARAPRAPAACAVQLSRRHRAPSLRLQVPPHHRPLRRRKRQVPGRRARRRVSRDRLQHGQRTRPRRHQEAVGACARPRRHRSRSRCCPRRLPDRRRARHRHRRYRLQPRLHRRLPRHSACAPLRKPARLLVPLVEEGWVDTSRHGASDRHLPGRTSLLAAAQGMNPDVLVLGCTHYPLLRPLIERAVPPGIRVIDSAEATAQAAGKLVGTPDETAREPHWALGLNRRPSAASPPTPSRNSSASAPASSVVPSARSAWSTSAAKLV